MGHGKSGMVELSADGKRVIKCVPPDETGSKKQWCLRSLLRECEVYCRLPPHERILEFYGFTADRDTAAITLEYMPNGDLLRYLQDHPEQTAYQRVLWCAQATHGLNHLHVHHVVHADLRPENMVVGSDKDLSLRLIDFGGSGIDDQPSLAAEATRYFLPRKKWDTNPTTDMFALGSSFYFIMTGREPYDDLDWDSVDEQFAKKAYPSDVYDLLIGSIIIKCWECQYTGTFAILHDLTEVFKKLSPD